MSAPSWSVNKIHSRHASNGKVHIVCILEGDFHLEEGANLVQPEHRFDSGYSITECPLTVRELEVLKLLAEGKLYKEIAAEINLSVSTIRTNLHNIYLKLGCNDRAQAVLKAWKEGWIKP